MITIEWLMTELHGLKRRDLERWIAHDWVHADQSGEDYSFRDIDVARVRLIHQLRSEMEIDERALPVVLSLLDQLYELRRRVRAFEAQR